MSSVTQAQTVKEKTKAKIRYLKKKKERKRNAKAATARNRDAKVFGESRGLEALDMSQKNAPSTDHPESGPGVQSSLPQLKDSVLVGNTVDQPQFQDETSHGTKTVSFPAFPTPKPIRPPAQTALARQGIDRAFLQAESIDPTSVVPIGDIDYLSERMKRRLHDTGVVELFAVQTVVLPFLLQPPFGSKTLLFPFDSPRDLCVSAPTGSGKTLAYVLPILEILSTRIVVRLRALIVLPTRDLVLQVKETMEAMAQGSGLKIGTAAGQHSFAHEQEQLVDGCQSLAGGSSRVDILICTPGRLIDHLNGTENFTLQHLRFLVIDEADRLLSQSFQDWLARVLAAINPPAQLQNTPALWNPVPRLEVFSPSWLGSLSIASGPRSDADEVKYPCCQKLMFSATLTHDPTKHSALALHNPKYIIVKSSRDDEQSSVAAENFTMPPTLKERMVICQASHKPLILFYVIHANQFSHTLVFTKSAESAARLVELYGHFEKAQVAETRQYKEDYTSATFRVYSSDLGPVERRLTLEGFKNGQIKILVCSDLISRGIDIENVSHVVNYDTPVDMRKYVHRAGRTARAGRSGEAWSLVEEHEARYFKKMLKDAGRMDKVKKINVRLEDLKTLNDRYEVALSMIGRNGRDHSG